MASDYHGRKQCVSMKMAGIHAHAVTYHLTLLLSLAGYIYIICRYHSLATSLDDIE